MQRDNSPPRRRRPGGRSPRAWWNSNFYFFSIGGDCKPLDQILEDLKGRLWVYRVAYCTEIGSQQRKAHHHFAVYHSRNVMVLREDMVDLFGTNDVNIKTPPAYDAHRIEQYVGKDQNQGLPLVWQLGPNGWEHHNPEPDCVSAEDHSEPAE